MRSTVLGTELDLNSSDTVQGEMLFNSRCAACHKPCERLVGPALKGAVDRVPDADWLFQWVKNSQSLLNQGNPYAKNLFEKFNKVPMPPQDLSNEDILNIMAYVEAADCNATASANTALSGDGQAYLNPPEDNSDYSLLVILIIANLLLAILLGILISNTRAVRRRMSDPESESESGPGPLETLKNWIFAHKKQSALILLIAVIIGIPNGWYALKGIGVYQGYTPEQPIKFSHKIHAGDMKIACQYCHSSAEKGKTSGIPSVNVCMNCHKAISKGVYTGTAEIQKIYDAAGWDKDKMVYTGKEKPIEWVRIHNLPDFAYFNHSQHVVVGQIECQTCHGPVEEMHRMKQYSLLTMRWCIDCHKKTAVKMDGNGYYDKMHEQLLKKHAPDGKKIFTVDDIGGLECYKCHY